METLTIHTLEYKGQHILVADEKVSTFLPEFIKAWEFEHTPYLADNCIAVGREVTSLGLTTPQGLVDVEGMAAARGKVIAQQILKDWNRTIDGGAPLPVSPENIATLPLEVIKEFGRRIENGIFPTAEEMEAMRVPTAASTPTTARAAE